MTFASIKTTVATTVSEELGASYNVSYANAIGTVVAELESREYDIVDALVEQAEARYGVNRDEVRAMLVDAGLSERPKPVVVPEPAEDEGAVTADDVAAGKPSKAKRLAKLEEDQATILSGLQSLTQTVAALKSLAERHLGSSL